MGYGVRIVSRILAEVSASASLFVHSQSLPLCSVVCTSFLVYKSTLFAPGFHMPVVPYTCIAFAWLD